MADVIDGFGNFATDMGQQVAVKVIINSVSLPASTGSKATPADKLFQPFLGIP